MSSSLLSSSSAATTSSASTSGSSLPLPAATTSAEDATMERIRRRTARLPPPPPGAERARMSGFLRMRQTAREWRMKTWYAVLLDAHVYWFAGKRDAQVAARLQGQAHVVGARESDGNGRMHVYAHAFEFTARNGRVFFCAAPSADEQQRWIAALSAAPRHERVPSTGSLTVSSSSSSCSDSSGSRSSSSLMDDKTSSRPPLLTRPSLSSGVDSLSFRRARTTSRLELDAKTPSDTACFACDAEFGSLRRRRHECGSCGRGFCRWHCAKSVLLDGGDAAGTRLARVCDACAQLQHFTTFALALTSAMMNRMGEPGGAASSIMCKHDCYRAEVDERQERTSSSRRSSSGSLGEPKCHRRQWRELRLVTSSHASFTALNLMCFLKKYARMPWLFARTISLFIPVFETDPEALAEYWVQFLGMFVPLIQSVYPEQEFDHATMPSFTSVSAAPVDYVHVTSEEQQSSLYLYMDITLAICRRSTSFALRTVWECLALYEDAQQRGNTVCVNYIMLMIYLVSAFKGDSELVANLWLRDAPEAQADALVCAMDDFLRVADAASRAAPQTLVSKWIHATAEDEMWSWKQRVVGVMSKCADAERLSSRWILALFSPVIAEGEALFESVISETNIESSSSASTPQRSIFTTRQERVFNSEANFVHNLTAIAERLRHVTPVSSRSKVLPDLLLRLQATLGSGVSSLSNPQFVPLQGVGSSSSRAPKILRVVLDEGKVFSTRCRAPTMIVFEALAPQADLRAVQEPHDGVDERLQSSDAPALPVTIAVKPPSRRKLGRQDSEMLDKMLCSFGKSDRVLDDEDSPRDQSAVLSAAEVEGEHDSDERADEDADDLENEPPPEVFSTDDARLVYEESTSATMLATVAEQESCGDSRKNMETWEEKAKRIQAASDFGELPGWTLVSVIAKSFDDLRQEVFALQLMTTLQGIFEGNDLGHLYLRPYKILCTGANAGLIETLTDAYSIDAVKKQHGSLGQYFSSLFGSESSEEFRAARQTFVTSMVASSVFCYLFQIKDRHNGNIMIDRLGHVMHIDFGFILSIMPGGAFSLEQDCPFKLTIEMVDVMGGLESDNYRMFREHFVDAMLAVRREYVKLLSLVHLTISDSPFPCFQAQAPGVVLDAFRRRLFLEHSDDVASAQLLRLVDKSYNHWGMRQYDKFQRSTNGILP